MTEDNAEREDLLIVIEVEKSDVPQKGTITVTKTGEIFVSVIEADGAYVPVYEIRPLAGAVYEIVAADDIYTPDGTLRYVAGTVVDTVTTGDDGTATSIALYLGTYIVREITAPYGYLLNDTPVNVELEYAGENVEVTEAAASFVNDRQRVSVSLSKVMEKDDLFGIGNGGEIADVVFGLYAAVDIVADDGTMIPKNGLLEVISVNENGIGTFNADLPLGEYYVREIATDEHYVLSDEKYPVVFDYAGQNETTVVIEIGAIENELIYGSIKGYKTDRETGADIAGAVFGLFRPDETVFTTETALLTAVSDENGIFTFENVPYGKWTIYELAPADGYLPNEEIYEVEVKSDEEVIEIDAVNDMIPEVKTTATVNGEHDIHTNVTVTIEDVVEYKHLILGKEYAMKSMKQEDMKMTKTKTAVMMYGRHIARCKRIRFLTLAFIAALLFALFVCPVFAEDGDDGGGGGAGDVAGAIEDTWNTAKGQVQSIVNNVVFPVIDMVLAIMFFVKLGTSYFDCAPVKAL